MKEQDPQQNWFWKLHKMLKSNQRLLTPIHVERGIAYIEKDKVPAFLDILERQFSSFEDDDDDRDEDIEVETDKIKREHSKSLVSNREQIERNNSNRKTEEVTRTG